MEQTQKYIDLFKNFSNTDKNIFAYTRVSTTLQTIDTQLLEIYNYCEKEKLYPPLENIYNDEGISGYKVSWKKRKLGIIIEKCKKGSIIIIPELSRIGRNMYENNDFLKHCNDHNIILIDIKNNIKYDGSFQSQIMGQLYGMVCNMERKAISDRVKIGMQIAKMNGKLYNRKTRPSKLDGRQDEVKKLLDEGLPIKQISKKVNVDFSQTRRFIIRHKLSDKYKDNYNRYEEHKEEITKNVK